MVRQSLLRKQVITTGAPQKDLDAAFEIAGTWDFKWPLNSKIRIAFQEPPVRLVSDAAFQDAKKLVIACAEAWTLPPTLQLDFDCPDLHPPFDEAPSPMDRHRSSFTAKEAASNSYDVLISLQDLPVMKYDPFRGPGLEVESVQLPVSTLGSYARRADYGAPTMYLGRFGRFLNHDFVKYFELPLVQSIIIHEFGHMLGLPHLHQHPDLVVPSEPISSKMRERVRQLDAARRAFYKDEGSVRTMLSDLLALDIHAEVVSDHLISVWRGNKEFSDWVSLSGEALERHQVDGTLDSIMTFPYYRFTLAGGASCASCSSIDDVLRALDGGYLTKPGAEDIRMLRRMYVP
ncbi:MAG: hypothetical protein ACOY0T_28215 [Myxococcota bacterium]